MAELSGKERIKLVDRIVKQTDPEALARIARETEDDLVREAALKRRQLILESRSGAAQGEKCPVCGAPLVNVEYYSAVKGAPTVTNVKTDWAAMKKTTTYTTPYSDFHRHTAVFCPGCANRKVKKTRTTGLVILGIGLLAILTGGILLVSEALSAVVSLLIAGGGILLFLLGKAVAGKVSAFPNERKGEPPVTNARLRQSEELHDEISALYVHMTPVEQIERAEGTNVVVGRGMVRRKGS